MNLRFGAGRERPLSAVPRPAKIILVAALAAQMAWHAATPPPVARASALEVAPPAAWLRAASFGEPIAVAALLVLYLQAFDNQPGLSVPFKDLDYDSVQSWLEGALALDPNGQYPLLMASHVYTQVPDPQKQRSMLEFVHREFLKDPERRWRWLAHCAITARHQLKDTALALRYAEDLTRHAHSAAPWARQMRIFILEDIGEREAATVLLGGLLATGEVTDESEIRFLTQSLERIKSVENSSQPSGSR